MPRFRPTRRRLASFGLDHADYYFFLWGGHGCLWILTKRARVFPLPFSFCLFCFFGMLSVVWDKTGRTGKKEVIWLWHIDFCVFSLSFSPLYHLFLFLGRLRLSTGTGHRHHGNDAFIFFHHHCTQAGLERRSFLYLSGHNGFWAGSRFNEDTPWCLDKDVL